MCVYVGVRIVCVCVCVWSLPPSAQAGCDTRSISKRS